MLMQWAWLPALLGLIVPANLALRVGSEIVVQEEHCIAQRESLLRERLEERRRPQGGVPQEKTVRNGRVAGAPMLLRPISGCYLPNGLLAPLRC